MHSICIFTYASQCAKFVLHQKGADAISTGREREGGNEGERRSLLPKKIVV